MPTPAVLLAPLLVLALGCAELQLVSTYDPQTDAYIAEAQREAGLLLLHLERDLGTSDGAFEQYQGHYDTLLVGVQALAVRAAARERNQRQAEQVATLVGQLTQVRDRHREGALRRAEIEPLRRILDQSFRAILREELSKQRSTG